MHNKNIKSGTYQIKNWDKYRGTKCPTYRSSWELHVMQYCDRNPAVLEWSSEDVVVPYFNTIKNRMARYFVDFYIKYRDRNGTIHEELIEVKPASETQKPVKGGKRKDVFEQQVLTYMTNQEKWLAANKYANERNWKFRILTENEIFR